MKPNQCDAISKSLNQFSRIVESLPQETLDIIEHLSGSPYYQIMNDLSDMWAKMDFSSLTASISEAMVDLRHKSAPNFDFSALTAPITEAANSLSAIVSSMSALSEQASQIPDGYIQLSQGLLDDLDRVCTQSRELGVPEWQDEHEQPLSPVPMEKGAPLITIDRAIALLSLLWAIFTFLVTQLPNAQLDELIQQNERLIDVQEEQLTLERQRTEQFQNLAQNLSDVIVELRDEIQAQGQQIEALREQLQNNGELPDMTAHGTEPGSLEQDTDPQDPHSHP